MTNKFRKEPSAASKIDKWKNRRAMAWRAFSFAIAYIFGVLAFFWFAPIEKIKSATELGSITLAVLGFFGAIITAYIGAATYQEVNEDGTN